MSDGRLNSFLDLLYVIGKTVANCLDSHLNLQSMIIFGCSQVAVLGGQGRHGSRSNTSIRQKGPGKIRTKYQILYRNHRIWSNSGLKPLPKIWTVSQRLLSTSSKIEFRWLLHRRKWKQIIWLPSIKIPKAFQKSRTGSWPYFCTESRQIFWSWR